MKKHPVLICRLTSSFLRCISAVFVFCILSGPAHVIPAAAAYEPGVDPNENNRQSPLKTGLPNIGIRGVLSSVDVLGRDASEDFKACDVSATFRLPWNWYAQSDWGADSRWTTGAGVLTGSGDTGLVVPLVLLLAFGSRDGKYSLDMGGGVALFTRTTFGTQDFGGHLQYSLTTGLSFPLFNRLGAGYRFMHYSDARFYGSHTTGADLHMLEVTYRFY